MKLFTNKQNITDTEIFIRGEDVNHIKNVMRLSKGDTITVCDGEKNDYLCEIIGLIKEKAHLSILEKSLNENEPSTKITLYQALPKAGKLEEIIQKATELGINEIIPIETAYSVVKVKDMNEKKYERYEKVAKAAAQQCKRGVIPIIKSVQHFKDIQPKGTTILAYEKETLSFANDLKIENDCSIIVGAEGGFSEEEISLAKERSFHVISLGKRILRLETASIVLATLVLNAKGEF
ncbi:MAG: 16S rRNA (uracil(1498)-N(3))-methyltransferase [Defluviitaleaceae bacterium]|nr:16S rRNA (uracil(1498)-N(3))-methyltransferase [Defluviitaleaceae bacterium]